MNLAQAFNDFLSALHADQRKDATLNWYASLLRDYVARYGSFPLESVTVQHNRQYISDARRRTSRYADEIQKPQQPGGFSDASISALVRAMNGFWNWCQRDELIKRNPMDNIRNSPPRKRAPRAISEADIIAIFDTCEDNPIGFRDRAMMAVMADCGVRVGGLCSIRLKTLNLQRGTLVVHEKADTVRQVPFSSYTALFLNNWIEQRPVVTHDYLFINPQKGNALTTEGVYQMLKRRKKLAGVTGDAHPHAWREFFARSYIERGGDVATAARLLGNSPEVILKNYSIFTSQEVMDSHEKYSPFTGLITDRTRKK